VLVIFKGLGNHLIMGLVELGTHSAERHSAETIIALKRALYMDPDMPQWLSSDGQYMYLANPIKKVPREVRPYMPIWRFSGECMNAWQLCRVSQVPIYGNISMDMYTIISDTALLVTRHEIDPSMLDEHSEKEVLKMISASAQQQFKLGLQLPETIDYANVDNALIDLAIEIELHRMATSG
jgi:hypothetical protein